MSRECIVLLRRRNADLAEFCGKERCSPVGMVDILADKSLRENAHCSLVAFISRSSSS